MEWKRALDGIGDNQDTAMVREGGLEPPRLAAPDPKSGASAVPPLSRAIKGLCSRRSCQVARAGGNSTSATRGVSATGFFGKRPGGRLTPALHAGTLLMAIAPRVPIGLRVSIGLRNAIGVREHLLRRLSACHPVGDFIEVESPYATDLETW